ncbi:hypothetical protein VUJ46_16170 [Chryseobacterium sp. MYb264]|uniref:hypothetical protein n=1 Tax=Chryseobacterium sp. MYb264 TaxID=2745153 RepID=UPI002E14912B|nr:hypothetical protein VUJ46_16170 [Chryseobacterium sp. MYb264]
MKTKKEKKVAKISSLKKLSKINLALIIGGIGAAANNHPIAVATTWTCTGRCSGTLDTSTGTWTQGSGVEYPDWD